MKSVEKTNVLKRFEREEQFTVILRSRHLSDNAIMHKPVSIYAHSNLLPSLFYRLGKLHIKGKILQLSKFCMFVTDIITFIL
jgi:hypothetical protein